MTVIAVLGVAVLSAVVALLIMSSRSDGQPTLKILIGSPTGANEAAPAEFSEFATSVYESNGRTVDNAGQRSCSKRASSAFETRRET